MINDYINNNKENIINNICDLIKIPSISIETDNTPNKPFGEACYDVLEKFLEIAKQMGFKTKNIDGYCGYAECGEGKEIIGIIGHLDVVPAYDGWTKCNPFEPIIQEGKLYGRGAIDDKGPVIACLYAMKYIQEKVNLNKRIRLIVGLNEEVSWKCIDYYKQKEELPTIGFSPDADFPCIYAEKGFLNTYINSSYFPLNETIIIKNINCKNAINIVPKFAEVTLKINENFIENIIKDLEEIILETNHHINIEKLENNELKLISTGVAAHSAHPDLGINALSRLIIVLNKLLKKYNINIPIINFITDTIGLELDGTSLGINCQDESGKLTLNLANSKLENNSLEFGINLRIPVTILSSLIKQQITEKTYNYDDTTVKFANEKNALFIPKNDKLIITLCQAFTEVTGQNIEPLAIGGATYARAFDNIVSFGAVMPGRIDMCHQADEYIILEDLFTSIKIYVKALKLLLQ